MKLFARGRFSPIVGVVIMFIVLGGSILFVLRCRQRYAFNLPLAMAEEDIQAFERLARRARQYLETHAGVLPADPYDLFLETDSGRLPAGELMVARGRCPVFERVLPLRLNVDWHSNLDWPVFFWYWRPVVSMPSNLPISARVGAFFTKGPKGGEIVVCRWNMEVSRLSAEKFPQFNDVQVSKVLIEHGLPDYPDERVQYLTSHNVVSDLEWSGASKMYIPRQVPRSLDQRN